MGKNKEEVLKQMSDQIDNINDCLYTLINRIEQLTEQVKKQQPIIVNPSPVWPTNIPIEPYWNDPLIWTYTTTTETTKTGDAK